MSANVPSITINGKTYENFRTNRQFERELIRMNFTDAEIDSILSNNNATDIQRILTDKLNQNSIMAQNKDLGGVIARQQDRQYTVDNLLEEKKLPENAFLDGIKDKYPKDKYPKLYKKDGSLNEKKVWKQFENDTMLEAFFGQTREGRIKTLMKNNNITKEEATKQVDAQDKRILDQEEKLEEYNRQHNTDEDLVVDGRSLKGAREGAKDFVKNAKRFNKNLNEVAKRINRCIDNYNNFDFNKLSKDAQNKIREQVDKYNASVDKDNATDAYKDNPRVKLDIFDQNGNFKPTGKNQLYQFIMDNVTGTDAKVNKSKRDGNFFQKIFQKGSFAAGTEKDASKDFGLSENDIKYMGFDWEDQISVGKVITDGLSAGFLSAVFGGAVSNSNSKTITPDDTTIHIDEKVPYKGSVDYLQNGKYVTSIPYSGAVSFVKDIVVKGLPVTAAATASAVLPAALIGTAVGALNSAYSQFVNGNEEDIFKGNLLDAIGSGAGSYSETGCSVDQLLDRCGNIKKDYEPTARALLARYADKNGIISSAQMKHLHADYIYNRGRNSNYLNIEEASSWLRADKKNEPEVHNEVSVNIPPEVLRQIVYDIQGNGDLAPSTGSQVIRIDDYEAKGAAGEARDYRTMKRNRVNVGITESQQRQNVNTNRAQYVVANAPAGERIQVTPNIINNNGIQENDYIKPKTVQMTDITNGVKHTFTYELVENATSLWPSLANETGPFYKLVSAVDDKGNSILNRNPHDEVFKLNLVEAEPETRTMQDANGRTVEVTIKRYDYNFVQDTPNYPGYGISCVDNSLYRPFNR